jgi:hypothetical protein
MEDQITRLTQLKQVVELPPDMPKVAQLPMRRAEFVAGFLALVLWFVVFGGGILVNTAPARAQLTAPSTIRETFNAAVIVFLFWTITNVGVLSCLSAFLGAIGRRTRFAVQLTEANSYADLIPQNNIWSHYASAVIRGFGIYAMVMAGLLVLATETFENPSQGGYLRLAATIALIAFYAGYDPELFAGVLQRVKRLIDPGTPPGEPPKNGAGTGFTAPPRSPAPRDAV